MSASLETSSATTGPIPPGIGGSAVTLEQQQQQQQQQRYRQSQLQRSRRIGLNGFPASDLVRDRAKLVACAAILLLHSAALTALDVIMLRRRCSGLLGCAFAVLAASLATLLASLLLALQPPHYHRHQRSRQRDDAVAAVGSEDVGEVNSGGVEGFSRRGVLCVAGLWTASLLTDVCWLGLTLARLGSECLGTAMIGATAVGLVACPASLVAFVILFGWFGSKVGDG